MKTNQKWQDAKDETVTIYPRPNIGYEVDLKKTIIIDKDEGRNYVCLMTGELLSLWNQQKSALAQLLDEKDFKNGIIKVYFKREEATSRLYPMRQ